MREGSKHTVLYGGAAIILVIVGFTLMRLRPVMKERLAERACGRPHIFATSSNWSFLPDTLAMTKAVEALAAQHLDTNRWKVETYSRTRAPDGTNDRYLCRNKIDDSRGIVTFTNSEGKFRWIHVHLTNHNVVCIIDRPRPAL